jgi:predicted phosphodiesterase
MKKYWQYSLIFLLTCSLSNLATPAADQSKSLASELDKNFIVRPYLQLGNHPLLQKEESLDLLWITNSNQDTWTVQAKSNSQAQWSQQKVPIKNILSYSVPEKLYIWDNPIDGLEPGEKFQYKVSKNGKEIFEGESTARKRVDQSFKVVLFGDTGANTLSEKKIVYQTYLKKPDLLVILGDITYNSGRLSEYFSKFFPIFGSSKASSELGAPLLQSTIIIPVIGNHDIAYGDNKSGINFDKLRDGLAYYQVWSAPLNGPLKSRSEKDIPKLLGSEENINRYLQSTGNKYPTMSNHSFDYANSHWLILDANPYMTWTNQRLRNWVKEDLIANKDKTWKFVCFHQPGFSIDKVHSVEQRMRLLSDIFQENGVDVVFSGHAHNYQKSFPMRFEPFRKEGNPSTNPDGTVSGEFSLDKQFDGKKNLHPKGVIYIVSGGGGAALYGSAASLPESFNFIDKFDAKTHSMTLCEVKQKEFKLSQISEDGKIIDSFKIQK